MFPANTDHSTIITTIEVNKCLNITSEETGACVLLRAASPVKGLEVAVTQVAPAPEKAGMIYANGVS